MAKTDEKWWVICGGDLLDLLRRAKAGEDPDGLYAEAYAEAEVDPVCGATTSAGDTEVGCELDPGHAGQHRGETRW